MADPTEEKALDTLAEVMHAGPGGGYFYADREKAVAVVTFLRAHSEMRVVLFGDRPRTRFEAAPVVTERLCRRCAAPQSAHEYGVFCP